MIYIFCIIFLFFISFLSSIIGIYFLITGCNNYEIFLGITGICAGFLNIQALFIEIFFIKLERLIFK